MQPIRDWKEVVFAATLLFAFAAASSEQPQKTGDEGYWTSLVDSTTAKPPTNRFTIGPLALLRGALALELDIGVADKVSWQLGGTGVFFVGPVSVQPSPPIELITGLRFFPLANDRAPGGFWLGVGGCGWIVESSFLPGIDATIGYTSVDRRGFTISIGGGAKVMSLVASSLAMFIVPVIHLNLGFAFAFDTGGQMRQTR
jgi:hypothetical protein